MSLFLLTLEAACLIFLAMTATTNAAIHLNTTTATSVLVATAKHLGTKVIGLVVAHRGRTMTLQPSGGEWEAITLAEPDGVEEHDIPGYGATPELALDACADEADLADDAGSIEEEGEEEDAQEEVSSAIARSVPKRTT